MKKPIWIQWINRLSGGYIDEFPVECDPVWGRNTGGDTIPVVFGGLRLRHTGCLL